MKTTEFLWNRDVTSDRWLTGVDSDGIEDLWLATSVGNLAALTVAIERGRSAMELMPHRGKGSKSRARPHYEPLVENTGLFRTFAGLGQGRQSYLDFATRYGPLGLELEFRPANNPTTTLHGEPLSLWREAVGTINIAVRLWDTLRTMLTHLNAEDPEALDDAAKSSSDAFKAVFSDLAELEGLSIHAALEAEATGVSESEVVVRWADPTYIGKRKDLAARIGCPISHSLTLPVDLFTRRDTRLLLPNAAIGVLTDFVDLHLRTFGSIAYSSSVRPGERGVFMSASNLLGALWLQFALSIDGNSRFERCARSGCAEWIELAPSVNRSDRRYCSPSCKNAAWRERIADALRLEAQGLTEAAIAKRMGADAGGQPVTRKQVRDWLAAGASRRRKLGGSAT